MNYFKHTEQKQPPNPKGFISFTSYMSFSGLLHVLLCTVFTLGPRFQAATNWNIAGPGWFLTDSQMITFAHNSLDKMNPTIPFHQKGQKLQFYYVSRCWRAWEHSVNWEQT